MFKYETHMHTLESSICSHVKAAEQVKLYKDRGYTGIIITDHLNSQGFVIGAFKRMKRLFTWEQKVEFLLKGYEKAKAEGDKIGLDVFLGWEFYDKGAEFLTYGLDKEFLLNHKDLDKMSIEEYSKLVRENGGYLAQAHPFRAKENKEAPIPHNFVDAIEVFNGSRIHKKDENKRALEYAKKCNIPMQAGSDAHHQKLAFYSGIVLDEKAENIGDIIDAIKSKKVVPILPTEEVLNGVSESVPPLSVRVFYDSKYAKDVAQSLSDYIQNQLEIDSICAPSEDSGRIESVATVIKTIYIGRHSDTKENLKQINSLQYDCCGMKYGFNENTCVITVSKSELRGSKPELNRFVVEYCKRFDENPEELSTREAQFKYVAMEFITTGLQEFVGL